MNQFVQYENIVPLLAPQDIAATATASSYMTLKYAQRASFMVFFGALTTATAADNIAVTLQAATAAAGTEVALSFSYRLSGALGTNTWGAVTTAATTGVTIASTDDNMILWIDVDPAAVQAELADAAVVRVLLTPAGMTASLVSVVGIIDSRYKQVTHKSATAAASA